MVCKIRNQCRNLIYLHRLLWTLVGSSRYQSGRGATSGVECWQSDQGRLYLLNCQEKKETNAAATVAMINCRGIWGRKKQLLLKENILKEINAMLLKCLVERGKAFVGISYQLLHFFAKCLEQKLVVFISLRLSLLLGRLWWPFYIADAEFTRNGFWRTEFCIFLPHY